MLPITWKLPWAACAAACMVLCVGASSAAAETPSQNAAATRAFIRSEVTLDQGLIAHAPQVLRAADAVVKGVSAGCPKVLAHAPAKGSSAQQLATFEFEIESTFALEVDALRPVRSLIDNVSLGQERLRFGEQTIQWQVHVSAAEFGVLLSEQPPDLCTDARALVASKYTKVSPAGQRFSNGALGAASGGTSAIKLVKTMSVYAPAAVRAAVKRLTLLQHRENKAMSPVNGAARRLFAALYGPASPLRIHKFARLPLPLS